MFLGHGTRAMHVAGYSDTAHTKLFPGQKALLLWSHPMSNLQPGDARENFPGNLKEVPGQVLFCLQLDIRHLGHGAPEIEIENKSGASST